MQTFSQAQQVMQLGLDARLDQYLYESEQADAEQAYLDRVIEETERDIELNRRAVAADVMAYLDGNAMDVAMAQIARLLIEKKPQDDTPSEALLRVVINDAITAYSVASINADK